MNKIAKFINRFIIIGCFAFWWFLYPYLNFWLKVLEQPKWNDLNEYFDFLVWIWDRTNDRRK